MVLRRQTEISNFKFSLFFFFLVGHPGVAEYRHTFHRRKPAPSTVAYLPRCLRSCYAGHHLTSCCDIHASEVLSFPWTVCDRNHHRRAIPIIFQRSVDIMEPYDAPPPSVVLRKYLGGGLFKRGPRRTARIYYINSLVPCSSKCVVLYYR